MPIKGRKFISTFLMPNLNSKRFGTRLMWLNFQYKIFQVEWNHKSASGWTKDDAEVFMEWDKIKGRYLLEDKDCYTKSKQRFRAVMYKLLNAKPPLVTKIFCSDKYKIYCFGTKENIPSEVILAAINSRESKVYENSSEVIYEYDPETVLYINEVSAKSFVAYNHTVNIAEDDKYANQQEQADIENEDLVPDNHSKDFKFCASPHMYRDIITRSLSEKQVLEDSYQQDINDYEITNISNNLIYDEDLKNNQYELTAEDYFSWSPCNNPLSISLKSDMQTLPFISSP